MASNYSAGLYIPVETDAPNAADKFAVLNARLEDVAKALEGIVRSGAAAGTGGENAARGVGAAGSAATRSAEQLTGLEAAFDRLGVHWRPAIARVFATPLPLCTELLPDLCFSADTRTVAASPVSWLRKSTG